jgi:hypothetical protein
MALGTPVVGAVSYASSSPFVAFPAGIVATDQVLIVIGQKPSVANTGSINGISTDYGTQWTLRGSLTAAGGYGATLGADTGNTNLRIYSWDSVVDNPTGSVTVLTTNTNVAWAFIVRVPTGGGTISYGSATGQQSSTPPDSSFGVNTTDSSPATNFQAGDLALWAMCIPTDVTTPNQFISHSIISSGASFAAVSEINEPDSTLNNDIGGFSAYTSVTSGTSSVAPTILAIMTGTFTNVRGPVVVVRMRETAVASGSGNFLQFF